MSFTESERKEIYDRTSGYCHICHKKVAFTNYGVVGARGAWEVEHSNPRAEGGTDRLNNLYPACIPCNRSKGTQSTRTVRARNGKTRAPLSRENREKAKTINAVLYGLGAAGLTYILYAPAWPIAGVAGLYLGYRRNPDK
jgi:5-methylcytosine-specific restriction endonuclease McrA